MFFGGGGGFPFGGMGMDDDDMPGGFPGMGGRRGPPKEVDNSKYYELLGVEKTATYDEIRKAFRKTFALWKYNSQKIDHIMEVFNPYIYFK